MERLYAIFKCLSCKAEFILLTEELEQKRDKYIVCPYCSSRGVKHSGATDNLKEVMRERSYKRNSRGAIEQKGY